MSHHGNEQRHERLKELMVLKVEKIIMAQQEGKRVTDAQHDYIEREIDHLLRAGDATEGSLHKVAVQAKIIGPKGLEPTCSKEKKHRHKGKSATMDKKQLSESAARQKGDGACETPVEHSPLRLKEHLSEVRQGDLWAKMLAKDVEHYNHEIVDQRKLKKKKEEEQRAFLDTQVTKRQEIKKHLVEDEKKYAIEETKMAVVWEEQARKEEEAKRRRHEEERRIRDEQLRVARDRKQREVEVLKLDDIAQAQKIKDAYEKEQLVIAQRRVKAKEEVAKVQAMNVQVKAVREAEHTKEAELDKLHQAQFLQRLEKQDEEREQSLLKMHERQKKQHIMVMSMEKSIKEKGDEDERKAQAYLARKEAKEIAAERAKREKERSEKVKLQQYLTLQIMEREKKKAEKAVEYDKEKEQLRRENEEAERRERERLILEKEKARRAREVLEAQIAVRSQIRPVFLSDAERQLNSKALRDISAR